MMRKAEFEMRNQSMSLARGRKSWNELQLMVQYANNARETAERMASADSSKVTVPTTVFGPILMANAVIAGSPRAPVCHRFQSDSRIVSIRSGRTFSNA
jgi:hypothetical protein